MEDQTIYSYQLDQSRNWFFTWMRLYLVAIFNIALPKDLKGIMNDISIFYFNIVRIITLICSPIVSVVSIEMELKKAFVCISKHLNTLFLILSELYHTNNTEIAPSISKSNMYSLLHRYPSSRKFYRLKTSQRTFFVDYIFPRLKENYNFRYYQFKMSRYCIIFKLLFRISGKISWSQIIFDALQSVYNIDNKLYLVSNVENDRWWKWDVETLSKKSVKWWRG